ncbi:MAG: winged helix DNA-binding domain-containing protein [Solirubrobacteraceae bacterium]
MADVPPTDATARAPGPQVEQFAEPGAVLCARTLNRALLERQLLLRRQPVGVSETLEHLVGLQAQNPTGPYFALWSRLTGFAPDDLAARIDRRVVVRIALMRWTLHVVTARDCIRTRPLVQPVMERRMRAQFGRHLAGVDLPRLVALGRSLVEDEPRSLGDVGRLLADEWPEQEPSVLGNALAALAPLVHVPPRGLWGRNGRAVQTTAERWLGLALQPAGPPDELLLRYLTAFGPASVDDMRTWSGLRGLGEAIERLRPRLRSFRDEQGRELLDVPDGLLPDPETPAPPRFLPECDNVVLSHADRSRIVSEEHRHCVAAHKTFLIDGFVRGTWRIIDGPRVSTLQISPLTPMSREDRLALAEEGAQLLAFAAGDDDARISVRFREA